jgi:predicted RNase H-like HicB family nuclease
VKVTAVVTRDENEQLYVARGVEVDVASQGPSVEEALTNLQEAIDVYFEDEADAPPSPTIAEVRSIEVTIPA